MSTKDYIDLTTDFGFKRFISNDDILIRFLNAILYLSDPIVEISARALIVRSTPSSPTHQDQRPRSSTDTSLPAYFPVERIQRIHEEEPGNNAEDKLIRYDVACITKMGAWINVEMQSSYQVYYYDRALFYTSRLISRQGWKGEHARKSEYNKAFSPGKQARAKWNWELGATYHIGILDFDFNTQKIAGVPVEFTDNWLVWSQLMFNGNRCQPVMENRYGESDLLNICLISLPLFKRTVADNVCTDASKFAWLLANLGKHEEKQLPNWLAEYQPVIDYLAFCKLDASEREKYQASVLAKRDLHDQILSSKQLGIEEGKVLGIAEGKVLGIEEGKVLAREKLREMKQYYKSCLSRGNSKAAALDRAVAKFKNDFPEEDILDILE